MKSSRWCGTWKTSATAYHGVWRSLVFADPSSPMQVLARWARGSQRDGQLVKQPEPLHSRSKRWPLIGPGFCQRFIAVHRNRTTAPRPRSQRRTGPRRSAFIALVATGRARRKPRSHPRLGTADPHGGFWPTLPSPAANGRDFSFRPSPAC